MCNIDLRTLRRRDVVPCDVLGIRETSLLAEAYSVESDPRERVRSTLRLTVIATATLFHFASNDGALSGKGEGQRTGGGGHSGGGRPHPKGGDRSGPGVLYGGIGSPGSHPREKALKPIPSPRLPLEPPQGPRHRMTATLITIMHGCNYNADYG